MYERPRTLLAVALEYGLACRIQQRHVQLTISCRSTALQQSQCQTDKRSSLSKYADTKRILKSGPHDDILI